MKFEKVNIGAFGKLSDKEFEFSPGINIIYGKNEAGKSTLSSFMKYMLYGFAGKGRTVSVSEKLKHTPWDGTSVSGSAQISCARGNFHIQRTGAAKSGLKVFSGGKECLFGKEPGEEFLGVDEQAFSKMAYIGQNNVAADGMYDLSDIVQNIVFAADETVDIEKARKKLTDYRNFFRSTRKTGKCFELEDKIRELKYAFDENSERHKTLLAAEAKLNDTRRKIRTNSEKAAELKAELENIDGYEAKLLLEKISEAKAQLEHAEEKLISSKDGMTFDGVLYTSEKISAINTAYEKCLLCAQQYKNSRIALEDAKNAGNSANNDEMLRKCNGRPYEELEGLADKAKQVRSSSRTWSVVADVFLVAGAGLAVLHFADIINHVAILPAAAAFAVIGAVCAVLSASYGKKLKGLLENYGFSSIKELFEFSGKLPEARRGLIELAAREKLLDEDAENKKREYDVAAVELEKLIAPFGVGAEKVPEIIARLKSGHAALESAAHEYKRCEGAYEAYVSANNTEHLLELAQKCTSQPARDKKTVMREYEFVTRANENLADLEKQYIKQAAAPASAVRKPSEILAERQALEAQLTECSQKADAANLALEALEGACEDLKGGISPVIEKKASELFSLFTGGKYGGLEISAETGLCVDCRGLLRDIAYMSTGTKDAAYLALRVALCETLFREKPVLVFDEVFAYFDNERLKASLEALEALSAQYQIFVFTCHEREKQLVTHSGANVIEM